VSYGFTAENQDLDLPSLDLVGCRFGRLIVLARAGKDTGGKPRYLCLCDCGRRKVMPESYLGRTQSCGCLNRELLGQRALRHGHLKGGKRTPEYEAFCHARNHCRNPHSQGFKYYGGRGIQFLFESFLQFFSELGPCPAGLTLDRIDNDGNYEPGNVRWATWKQQAHNRSRRKAERGKQP
jgi:hypothetical protein